MSRFIPNEIIRDIQDKADIYEVISGYIPLKKSGSRWKGLCPFHQEKTPSFFVNTDAQAFHCFGCGRGGNVFTFVMEKEKVDFLEAAHILADRYNIFIPETKNPTNADKADIDKKDRIYKLHELAAELYSKNLDNDREKKGLDYLKNRGINNEAIKQFRLGFAPDSWDYVIKQAKVYDYTQEELIDSGLVVKKENSSNIYDRFRNRITFPIWNERGKVIGFSARTIEANPQGGKYVNSPETSIFKKSRVLYALPFARKGFQDKKFAILCEGQLDVIAMHRAGFNNTVAPQGTAFTEEQARLLKRYTNRTYICFDGDEAGTNAAIKAIEILLPLNFEVKIITLPSGQDPDTIYSKEGKEKIEEYINNATDSFDFLFNFFSLNEELHMPHGKNNVIQKILAIIKKIDNTVIRTSYISPLAKKLSLPESALHIELNKILRNKRQTNSPEKQGNKQIKAVSRPIIDTVASKAEEQLLELVILHGDIGRRLEDELPHDIISSTPIGKALNQAISLTISGEWENIGHELNMTLTETPDKTLSKILTVPNEYQKDFNYQKAVTDCINKIKKSYLDTKIHSLIQILQTITDIDKKKETLNEITKAQKEKLKLN